MEVRLKQVDDINAAFPGKDYDAGIRYNGMQQAATRSPSSTPTSARTASRNGGAWGSAELDGLIQRLSVEFDAARRNDLLKQVQEDFREEVPITFAVARQWAVALNDDFADYEPTHDVDHYIVRKDVAPGRGGERGPGGGGLGARDAPRPGRLGQALLALFGMSLLVWGLLPLDPRRPGGAHPAWAGQPGAGPGPDRRLAPGAGARPAPARAVPPVGGPAGAGAPGGQLPLQAAGGAGARRRARATLLLAAGGALMAVAIALPLAVLAARYENRWPDQLSRLFALVGTSLPSFWIGLLLLDLFAVRLRWTSALARADLQHLPLPAFVLGLGLASVLTRILRAGLVGETGRRYALVLRARGPAPGGCSCATACPTPPCPG